MTTHQIPLRPVASGTETLRPPVATARRMRAWVLFVVVVVGAFFGLTYSRTSLDDSAIKLDKLDEQIVEQQARHSDLRAQVAGLRDPRRIAEQASRAGLVFPRRLATLTVEQVDSGEPAPEERWAQLKSLLSADSGAPGS